MGFGRLAFHRRHDDDGDGGMLMIEAMVYVVRLGYCNRVASGAGYPTSGLASCEVLWSRDGTGRDSDRKLPVLAQWQMWRALR